VAVGLGVEVRDRVGVEVKVLVEVKDGTKVLVGSGSDPRDRMIKMLPVIIAAKSKTPQIQRLFRPAPF
jgi:hypothetical protein